MHVRWRRVARLRYALHKARVAAENWGVADERLLFHGTRANPPGTIVDDQVGFDMRFSQEGLWGRGTYFAEDAAYFRRADILRTGRGGAAAATWIFRGGRCLRYRLWRDADARAFGLENAAAFAAARNEGARSDVLRYEVLWREGGVYRPPSGERWP